MTEWLTKEELFQDYNFGEVSLNEVNTKAEPPITPPSQADEFRVLMELGREHARKQFQSKHNNKLFARNAPLRAIRPIKSTLLQLSAKKIELLLMGGDKKKRQHAPKKAPATPPLPAVFLVASKKKEILPYKDYKEALKLKMLNKRNRQLDAVIASADGTLDSL